MSASLPEARESGGSGRRAAQRVLAAGRPTTACIGFDPLFNGLLWGQPCQVLVTLAPGISHCPLPTACSARAAAGLGGELGAGCCMHPTQAAAGAGWGLRMGCMPASGVNAPGTSRHIPTCPGCPNHHHLEKLCVCCSQGWGQCALYCAHPGEPIHTHNTLFCHPSFPYPTHPWPYFILWISQDVLLRSSPDPRGIPSVLPEPVCAVSLVPQPGATAWCSLPCPGLPSATNSVLCWRALVEPLSGRIIGEREEQGLNPAQVCRGARQSGIAIAIWLDAQLHAGVPPRLIHCTNISLLTTHSLQRCPARQRCVGAPRHCKSPALPAGSLSGA